MRLDMISAVATIIGGISLFAVYRLIVKFISETHNKKVLKKIIERDRIRREVLDHTSADSVTFFKTHSRGGRTSHLKSYRTTCIRGTKEEENKYRDLVVDENYVNILLSLIDSSKIYYCFITEDEVPSLLKSILEEEGTERAVIYYIDSIYSGIFYVMFSKCTDIEFSHGDLFKFKEAVDKVKSLRSIF